MFAGSFIAIESAFAYVDPGIGFAISGSLWPLMFAIFSAISAFVVKYFWTPIKKEFLKLRSLVSPKR